MSDTATVVAPEVNVKDELKKLDVKLIAVINFLTTYKIEAKDSRTFTDVFAVLGEVHQHFVNQIDSK